MFTIFTISAFLLYPQPYSYHPKSLKVGCCWPGIPEADCRQVRTQFFLFFWAISNKALSFAWLQEYQKNSVRCTQILNTTFTPTQAHTYTPRAETRRNNKKFCRNIYFKIEAIAQLCTDLQDSRLYCFSAGACETLPVAAKQADKALGVPVGLEGLSTVLLATSQHHHAVLTLAALHRSVRETGENWWRHAAIILPWWPTSKTI